MTNNSLYLDIKKFYSSLNKDEIVINAFNKLNSIVRF